MNKLVFTKLTDVDSALLSSFRSDCVVHAYNKTMNIHDFDVSNITYLAFVWHNPGNSFIPFFSDDSNSPFAEFRRKINDNTQRDDTNKIHNHQYKFFHDNLIALFRNLPTTANVDLISCSLNEPNLIESINKIKQDLGINIRYSLDKTGNLLEKTNWILESDNVNIKNLYFTNNINNWTGVLALNKTPSQIGSAIAEFTWDPLSKTLSLTANIDWKFTMINAGFDPSSYIVLSDNQVFDGQEHIINLGNITNWSGLFRSSASSSSKLSIIKNLGIINGSVDTNAGYIIGFNQNNFKIDNCYSTGNINTDAGGICGEYSGKDGYCEIVNSHTNGTLINNNSGGICGPHAGDNGYCLISNCYSTGNIDGENCGGICALYAGINDGNCTINDCYSTGNLNGENCGGIGGAFSGQEGNCTITNCYSIGNIFGDYSGGICGSQAGKKGNCTINKCYTTGVIDGIETGGICGQKPGYDNGKCTVTNCYSLGVISGESAGGICGRYCGNLGGTCSINSCFSMGNINGAKSGGICGQSAGREGTCNVSECYSLGSIRGHSSGGICGSSTASDTNKYTGECIITSCYTTNDIIGEHAGGICGSHAGDDGICKIANCYVTGKILGINSGGICGFYAGSNSGNCTIKNCYSETPLGYSPIIGNGTDSLNGNYDIKKLIGDIDLLGNSFMAITCNYPLLHTFQSLPWEYNKKHPKYYNKYNQVAVFHTKCQLTEPLYTPSYSIKRMQNKNGVINNKYNYTFKGYMRKRNTFLLRLHDGNNITTRDTTGSSRSRQLKYNILYGSNC